MGNELLHNSIMTERPTQINIKYFEVSPWKILTLSTTVRSIWWTSEMKTTALALRAGSRHRSNAVTENVPSSWGDTWGEYRTPCYMTAHWGHTLGKTGKQFFASGHHVGDHRIFLEEFNFSQQFALCLIKI